MPATTPRVTVATAERAGSNPPSQDRVFTGRNFAIVLDGASHPDETERDGGWIADTIGHEVAATIHADLHLDLADALAQAINITAKTYGLQPGKSPSTTITILRWTDEQLEALVLGDSPVIVQHTNGTVDVIRDDRLHAAGGQARQRYEHAIAAGGFGNDHPRVWRDLITAERAARNTPDGYWITEADPQAASHAIRTSWPITDIRAALAVTDGVTAGIDTYGTPANWNEALDLARRSPEHLLHTVHAAETTDPHGQRWPRSKKHDDKAAALLLLEHPAE